MSVATGTTETPFSMTDLTVRDRWMVHVRDHYENFPVGSWLMPRALRPHVHRIYAFARAADDIADEHRDLGMLDDFERQFRAHLAGARGIGLFEDLTASIEQRGLPVELLFDLLAAFRSDLLVRRYDHASLMAYCSKSANPIGRLMLCLYGTADAQALAESDQICTALQLLNHLQDMREDLLERDRIYFPTEDLVRFGVTEADLRETKANAAVRALVEHWCSRVCQMFRAGYPLTQRLRGRFRLEIRAILSGAAAVVEALRAAHYDVLSRPIRLSRGQRARALVRGLLRAKMPHAFR